MNENSYLKHKIFLLSLFVLGNTVIVFPTGIGIELSFLALIISVVPTVYLVFLLLKIGKLNVELPRFAEWVVAAFGVVVFVICTRDYITFVDTMRLPETPKFLLSLIFIIVCIVLGYLNKKVLYQFALVSFIITFLSFIFVFLFSADTLDFSAIKISDFSFNNLLRQSLTFFIHSFGQLIIIAFFFKDYTTKQSKKIYLFGVLFGIILMIIYVMNILLVLGGEVAALTQYPYSTLTAVVSFSRNYSRLDGFTYYVYFYSSLIKNAVCVNVMLSLLNTKRKTAVVILAAVLLILCNINNLQDYLHSDMANLIILIFELLFPLVLFLGLKFKSRRTQ